MVKAIVAEATGAANSVDGGRIHGMPVHIYISFCTWPLLDDHLAVVYPILVTPTGCTRFLFNWDHAYKNLHTFSFVLGGSVYMELLDIRKPGGRDNGHTKPEQCLNWHSKRLEKLTEDSTATAI